ncbi:MAG: site-2 protease family protein [Thermoanaerobaculales bacterium]|nr:site-2 protease family protein [Thermoanaerobaculales bacterium]
MHLRFELFGFPVVIQPFFLITAWLIGPRGDLMSSALWIISVFLGVLAHELGHAFAGRHFGLDPMIQLHGFGGMTSWRNRVALGHGRRILLSAAGPAVGIAVGLSVLALAPVLGATGGILVAQLLTYTVWVNLGWGLLNLVPVLPLDGGHIASSAAEAAFGPRGKVAALIVSLMLTVSLGLWAIWNGQIWLTILAVILSISNLQALGPFRSKEETQSTQKSATPTSDAIRAYDMARSLAASRQFDEALEWLEAAIRSGLKNGAVLDADPIWAPLRDTARFAALRRSLRG